MLTFIRTFAALRLACMTLLTSLCWLATPAAATFVLDSGLGGVRDTGTGLVWDQCPYGQSGANCATGTAQTLTWPAALAAVVTANSLNHNTFSDWRLPNKQELESLVQLDTTPAPATLDNTSFPGMPLNIFFWTSTSFALSPENAWYVNFNNGRTSATTHTTQGAVRLVRAGNARAARDLLAVIPALSNVAVIAPTTSGLSFSGTSSTAGAFYWLVVPAGSTAPTAEQVRDGIAYGAIQPVGAGTTPAIAGQASVLAQASLAALTPYDLYLVAEENSGTGLLSPTSALPFTTLPAAVNPGTTVPPIQPVPTLGEYGLMLLMGMMGWLGMRRARRNAA